LDNKELIILNIMRRKPENKLTVVSHKVSRDKTYSIARALIVLIPKCVQCKSEIRKEVVVTTVYCIGLGEANVRN